MKLTSRKIILRSLIFHMKEYILQIGIVSVLTAIICGSLLTGNSVRGSLRKNLEEKRGNADFVVSSGLRYFDASISYRFNNLSKLNSTAIVETEGFCRNFSSGEIALDIKVFGIDSTFFPFQGFPSQKIKPGFATVNKILADKLDLSRGDEVILSIEGIRILPSSVPFAPEENETKSSVFRITQIISGAEGGNFSLGSSQSQTPAIFVNARDIQDNIVSNFKANRLLIHSGSGYSTSQIFNYLKEVLTPGDMGLTIRTSHRTREPELISDRIFIDSAIVSEIDRILPPAAPVITYLANSFDLKAKSTPYSFISALPSKMLPGLQDKEIILSGWLAEDLDAVVGDTLIMSWYDPGSGSNLRENRTDLIVKGIAEDEFPYSDPSLMPEFPGISGSTTCGSWDAGVPLSLKRIRKKDEDYWTNYKGTPKAFINYNTGLRLWGNNFGPATAIRFNPDLDSALIVRELSGKIEPSVSGFSVTDLKNRNIKASAEGVDFGTLFLSLSFFIILSCILLLSMALKLFIDSRKREIRTYQALGFTNKRITGLVFSEALLISAGGALSGSLLGYLVNVLIIKSLNSVWTGAVQTNTLIPGFDFIPLLYGFIAVVFISALVIIIRLKKFFKENEAGNVELFREGIPGKGLLLTFLALSVSFVLILLSVIFRNSSTILAFTGGTFLFISLIMSVFYIISRGRGRSFGYSGLYYSYYPIKAVTPIIFLAAGIFAVILTGANHQVVSDKMLLPGGGTGGFLLWAESAIPVNYDLNSSEGKAEFGFQDGDLMDISFVQAGKLKGDDASCLNITHVTAPPILGIDPVKFIYKGSFSFASKIKLPGGVNPWSLLSQFPGENLAYGIADQTVLQWGLKLKTGDTLKYISENGQVLNIIICAGLKSSVFQGYLLIGKNAFEKYFPSVSGSSVFLIHGKSELTDIYKGTIEERLSGYGISVEPAIDRLASFFEVSNTYLDVFALMGVLGMILGVGGLGFILARNFNSREKEFALMIASGYTGRRIRRLLLKDHFIILAWGILTGSLSALCATWPSVASGSELPWKLFAIMLVMIFLVGYLVLLLSEGLVEKRNLVVSLRRE
jgi:putative ABC transport system permease protein